MAFDVRLQQGDFARNFKRLARAIRSTRRDACSLAFIDGRLVVSVAGTSVSAQATGSASEVLTIDRASLQALAKIPEFPGTLTLRSDDRFVHVETESFSSSFQLIRAGAALDPVVLPLSASLLQILGAGETQPADSLRAAGLEGEVREARRRRDEAIERAFRHLVAFGVSREELENLVAAQVRKSTQR